MVSWITSTSSARKEGSDLKDLIVSLKTRLVICNSSHPLYALIDLWKNSMRIRLHGVRRFEIIVKDIKRKGSCLRLNR